MKDELLFPCPEWAEKLADLHLGDLPTSDREALDAHLAVCPACPAVLSEYRLMDEHIHRVLSAELLPQFSSQLLSHRENAATDEEKGPSASLHRQRPTSAFTSSVTPQKLLVTIGEVLAAIIVIGAILSGFFWLNQHHHARVGHSGPSIAAAVYVGTYNGSVYALRPSDGSILWQHKVGNHITASTVANGIVYICSDASVYALRASDGVLLWQYRTDSIVFGSPEVVNGVVYVGSNDYFVYALRASDGSQLWEYQTRGEVDASPAVVNGVVYFSSHDDYIYALRASDGTRLWRYQTGQQLDPSQVEATLPVVSNGVVYMHAKDGYIYALRTDKGTRLWRFQVGTGMISPAVANGVIYVTADNGFVYALRASDGTRLWNYQVDRRTGGDSPIVVDGVVYVSSADGSVYAMRASDGTRLWRSPLSDFNFVNGWPPVVAHNVIYTSTGKGLYALRTSNGSYLWHIQLGGDITSLAIGP